MDENTTQLNRLPRVLLISPVPPPYGGIGRWTRTLLDMDPGIVGAQLVLINTAHREQRTDETTSLHRVRTGATQVLRVISQFLMHLARHGRPDCVHLNTSGSLGLIRDILMLVVCRMLGLRSVLHLRFGRAPEVLAGRTAEAGLLRLALRLACSTISIDGPTHDAVTSVIGERRSVLIPNFIDTGAYMPRFARQAQTVLFLGSVVKSKGVGELIEAWTSLRVEGWTLNLVGPLSPTIESLVDSFRDDPSLVFIGAADHEMAMRYMYEAAFMVLPSHTEGFPNVVLEAMATGTPVIASAVGAVPQILQGGAGVVVPPKDPAVLRDAMLHFITDVDARDRVARRAHERVVEKYSNAVVLQQYRRVWSSGGRTRGGC